jgi:DNA-binding GntR family transcriptional regulator
MAMKQAANGKGGAGGKPELSLVVEQDPHSLREKTVVKLREAIIGGYFEPGQQLVERDLCATTGVSRTSLREALRHLESEGVVESRKGEGVFVKALTAQDVRDIYELRMALDAEAIEHFSDRAGPEDRARLQGFARKWGDVDFDDFDRVVAANNDFFSILYEGAGNKLSLEIIRSLQTRISLLRAITSRKSSQAFHAESIGLQADMIAAIDQGNSRAAAKLARQYAARSLKFALTVLPLTSPEPEAPPDARPRRGGSGT